MTFARASASLFVLALAILARGPEAAASPKGYDIERLMRQGMPAWREGRYEAPPAPQPRPLERIPTVPAPAITPAEPPAPALAPSPTAAPAPRPEPASPPRSEAAPETKDGQIIRREGAPRSTVSGAWGR